MIPTTQPAIQDFKLRPESLILMGRMPETYIPKAIRTGEIIIDTVWGYSADRDANGKYSYDVPCQLTHNYPGDFEEHHLPSPSALLQPGYSWRSQMTPDLPIRKRDDDPLSVHTLHDFQRRYKAIRNFQHFVICTKTIGSDRKAIFTWSEYTNPFFITHEAALAIILKKIDPIVSVKA